MPDCRITTSGDPGDSNTIVPGKAFHIPAPTTGASGVDLDSEKSEAITRPVFAIGDSNGLYVFSSAAAAEAEFETIDIEEHEYEYFFDSEGKALVPEVVEHVGKRNPGRWRLRRPQVAAQYSDMLRGCLVMSLARVGHERTGVLPAELQRLELPTLVEMIRPYAVL